MKHGLTGIDHPVVGVRDMAAARAAYERLGFIVPPRGSHPEWGTGNWCIQFARDYLELRGLVKPTAAREAAHLQNFLAEREGWMGVAFGTTSADHTHDSLVKEGLRPRAVRPLTRDFELPEGTQPVSFRLCFLEAADTPGLLSVVVCEHLTPERLRRPEWLRHPNGALRVVELVCTSADPRGALRQWTALFDEVGESGGSLHATLADGSRLALLSPRQLRARFPEGDLPPEGIVSCVLAVSDLPATARLLSERNVAHQRLVDRLVVSSREACGAILEFVAAS